MIETIEQMAIKLEKKDAEDWKYRGEGAANLVLAYNGSSPTFMGKVIRVQKIPRNMSKYEHGRSFLPKHELLLWEGFGDIVRSPNKEIADQRFVQCVMAPLLGAEFVDPGVCVLVSKEFLESVERNVLCQRPLWRVNAAKVNICSDSVLLMSDHSVFPCSSIKSEPCISVEIKPKCGFLPYSSFVADKNAFKKNVTRFKMHQALKVKDSQISQLSEFDPLDLFSGSRKRIDKAIKALIATPQNNLRVFRNGALIYGGLGGGSHGTSFAKAEAFEDYIRSFIRSENSSSVTSFVNLVREAIVKLGVLDRLLEVQKFDKLDIEGAIHAYYDVVAQSCKVCGNTDEDRKSSKYSSLHSLPLEESRKIVKDYLIAATAKDCSLMISFRPMHEGDPESHYRTVYLNSTNQRFKCKACFIDLDLKPLKKMEFYYELDQKIVNCYRQMVNPVLGAVNAGTIKGGETGYWEESDFI
ncbi:inositol-pentakisphosphate 2-kinase-like [Silene latifolia]|uniref:inositol-pentakisphosphate 2-kinase-like n=1 Tax=Silene latifolia TaxID=37657 RepID=UPI003D774CD4